MKNLMLRAKAKKKDAKKAHVEGDVPKGRLDRPMRRRAEGGSVMDVLSAGLPGGAASLAVRGIQKLRGDTSQKTVRDVAESAGSGSGGSMMGKAVSRAGRIAEGKEDRKKGGRVCK